MALLSEASLANVSWQGINPPGAGGDPPLVYPATTLAALAAWNPESRRSPPPPGARVSSPGRCSQTQTPLENLGAIVLVLILS